MLRALICSSPLLVRERSVDARGHRMQLSDAHGRPLAPGRLWIGTQCYPADANGCVTVPFVDPVDDSGADDAAAPAPVSVAVQCTETGLVTLATLALRRAGYRLRCAFAVERGSVVAGAWCTVVARPTLECAGEPIRDIAAALVEPLVMRVEVTGSMGVDSVIFEGTVDSRRLRAGDDISRAFLVPEGCRTVAVSVAGRVLHARGRFAPVSASCVFKVASRDDSIECENVHLRCTEAGYAVLVLGRNGEPRPGTMSTCRLFSYYIFLDIPLIDLIHFILNKGAWICIII
jgi:hypothetical protein